MKTIAITMGDPAGVGAEVIVKALANLDIAPVRFIVIGDCRFLNQAIQLTGVNLHTQAIKTVGELSVEPGAIPVLDLENANPGIIPTGIVTAEAGKAAYQYLESAVSLALAKEVAAIVTAPLNKAALNLGGHHFNGHTEILAQLTGTQNYAMMLVEDGLRVVHVTTHVALRKACDLVTKERVYRVIHLACHAGKQLGLADPFIGVAGLNPHAGEGGLFGDEEIEQIIPAIEAAKQDGIKAEGPIPPDTVFVKTRCGIYDFAVAMYHDQGHIPVKMAGFTMNSSGDRGLEVSGVNVTLGLPIIRTSVDHGTAFDQAGKGTASARSMIDAIKLAIKLSGDA